MPARSDEAKCLILHEESEVHRCWADSRSQRGDGAGHAAIRILQLCQSSQFSHCQQPGRAVPLCTVGQFVLPVSLADVQVAHGVDSPVGLPRGLRTHSHLYAL